MTKDAQGNQLAVTREILDDFPRSRHRSTLITTGSVLASAQRLLLPRWNFRRADWERYPAYVEDVCRSIPPNSESVTRFSRLLVASAKKFIPRGARKYYTPCWTTEAERLYEEYETTGNQETAEELLRTLESGRRARWQEMGESSDFSRSSLKAWRTIKKLDPESNHVRLAAPIEADEIANEIKKRGTSRRTQSSRRVYANRSESPNPQCRSDTIPWQPLLAGRNWQSNQWHGEGKGSGY